MAIWQFDVDIVPSDGGFSSGDEKSIFENKKKFLEYINSMLKPAESWHEELRIWATKEHHFIEIWFDGEGIAEIRARIDLRGKYIDFIYFLVELCQGFNMNIYRMGELVNCSFEDLKHEIEKSDEKRFVVDPEEFLENISTD